ncbi:DUF5318 family protein [Corynebacterium lubricantis]|uniref:DUF5318 family protein n=1 Tax=Corynebacterium lubricantis TaxID=541095 RepID=UPI0003798F60|nr:DUF5318 family protein [Corynebacterium lubricantis]
MIIYSHQISHEWERRNVLRHVQAGRMKREEVCDADFLLITAAKFHGAPAGRPCPICEGELRTVKWIYGEQLGRRSGTARSDDEILAIIQESGPVTVHNVEVCPSCSWNHLLTEAQADIKATA